MQPLSTPLSQTLIAFTIELDNEFERRFAEAGVGRPFGVSLVMWSNLMRFVGDGIAVGDLLEATVVPRGRTLSTIGGMERWGYVSVGPDRTGPPSTAKRDGYGSARGIRPDWILRPTGAGRAAQAIWRQLVGEIEERWLDRFGADCVGSLRRAARALVDELDVELPEYLPIVSNANGMTAEIVHRPATAARRVEAPLPALLSHALLAYTLDFERESDLSLPLSANVVRVLDETGTNIREVPLVAGVSKEAMAMAASFLTKNGLVVVEAGPETARTKRIRLTPTGREAREAAARVHPNVERRWEARFGAEAIRGLRAAVEALLEQRDGQRARLSLGLRPHAGGWRATKRYLEQTNAVLADPRGRLPHYPMVLHRGGWPDGS